MLHRGSETSIEKMNRTNICSPPNLQNQVYFAIRLEYKDMKQLCSHLGGDIALLLKNDLKNLWKIGNDDIDDDGIWLGIVQGEKLDNGTYQWLDDRGRHGKGKPVVTDIKWSKRFTYNNRNRGCVKIEKASIDRGDNLWTEADCQEKK